MRPPTRLDNARIVIQFRLGLAEPPPADHPDVIAEAKRRRWGTLMIGADLAQRGMDEIRETYGSFPRPVVQGDS